MGYAVALLTEQIEDVVNTLTAVFSHHPWTDVPPTHKLHDVLLQVVQLGEYRLVRAKSSLCAHEVIDATFCARHRIEWQDNVPV